MNRPNISTAVLLASILLIAGCSGPKEDIQQIKPEISKPHIETPPPARVFKYENRYFVRNASIDNPANIDDPLQAIRVIQLKEGPNAVLVISSFDKSDAGSSDAAVGTWLGLEFPSLAPGTYDIARAVKTSFYRFDLGQARVRYDGKTFSGTVTIESDSDDYLTGSLDIHIAGETKGFDKPHAEFKTSITGSFRIQEVPLEATIIKGKR
jgi:hypothetical protein